MKFGSADCEAADADAMRPGGGLKTAGKPERQTHDQITRVHITCIAWEQDYIIRYQLAKRYQKGTEVNLP